MTTDEVCSLSSGDIETILSRLADAIRQGESSIGEEVYHHWLELHLRYPDTDFRLEAVSQNEEKEEHQSMDPQAENIVPQGIPGAIEGRICHYVAYNNRHLAAMIIGYDPSKSYSKADLVVFTNMSNVNGDKNFGMQFHQDVEYSDVPHPGRWHWMERV